MTGVAIGFLVLGIVLVLACIDFYLSVPKSFRAELKSRRQYKRAVVRLNIPDSLTREMCEQLWRESN